MELCYLWKQNLLVFLLLASLIAFFLFLYIDPTFVKQLLSFGVTLSAIALTIDTVLFSTYFSIRSSNLSSSREKDLQAFIKMQNIKAQPSKIDILSIIYLLDASEDERRTSSVRLGSSVYLTIAGVFFIFSLITAVISVYAFWIALYCLGFVFVFLGIVVHLWNLGYIVYTRGVRKYLKMPKVFSLCRQNKIKDVSLLPCRFPFLKKGTHLPEWWTILIEEIETEWNKLVEERLEKDPLRNGDRTADKIFLEIWPMIRPCTEDEKLPENEKN